MLVYPPNNHETDSKTIYLLGFAEQTCKVNGENVTLSDRGNFCEVVDLKLGKNTFKIEIDGKEEELTILGIKAADTKPIAYGLHYNAFPSEQPSKHNVLRSIMVSNDCIKIPLTIPPIYSIEKHGSYKYFVDLADMEMDLEWICYQEQDCNVIVGEVINSRFPVIFKKPVLSLVERWEDDYLTLDINYRDSDFKVCLDPGHGGEANGAISPKGILEKDLNLKLAQKVKTELEQLGITVVMTRDDDSTVSLDDRVTFAKLEHCQLFLSLHHNSLPDARNPNLERGVSLHYYHEQSKPFAVNLLDKLVHFTDLPYAGLYKQSSHVLRETTDCASVLVELGYLVHPEESEIISSEDFQALASRIIAKAVLNYYVKKTED